MVIKNRKSVWYFLLGLAAVPVIVYASTPATVDYVDEKIAILQAEINQIINGR